LYREGYTIKGAQQVLKTGAQDDNATETVPASDSIVDMSQALSLLQEASRRLARLEQA